MAAWEATITPSTSDVSELSMSKPRLPVYAGRRPEEFQSLSDQSLASSGVPGQRPGTTRARSSSGSAETFSLPNNQPTGGFHD